MHLAVSGVFHLVVHDVSQGAYLSEPGSVLGSSNSLNLRQRHTLVLIRPEQCDCGPHATLLSFAHVGANLTYVFRGFAPKGSKSKRWEKPKREVIVSETLAR
jgi:hypothetical protein